MLYSRRKRVYRFLILLIPCLFLTCSNIFNANDRMQNPVVIITFDDGHESVYKFGFKIMKSIDSSWAATHFLPVVSVKKKNNVTLSQLKEMEDAGWETGGHGYTHENLTSVPLDSAEKQINKSYNFLKDNGLNHESFAYPTGNYNYNVQMIVEKKFKNIRTSHDFMYLDGINRKKLGYFAVKGGHTCDDIISRVERAKQFGAPLVVIGFHAIIPDDADPPRIYWCRESAYRNFLKYLKKEEVPVMTVREAMHTICKD